MRILAMLLAFFSCWAVASAGVATPGFYELESSSAEAIKYEQGRTLALQLLGDASGLDDATAILAVKAAEQLAMATIYVSADAEGDRQCAKIVASLFVTRDFPNAIFICADTRWHVQNASQSTERILAQGFIHEAVHLSGVSDECKATLFELEITRNGLGSVHYGNVRRYAKLCNGLLNSYAPKRR